MDRSEGVFSLLLFGDRGMDINLLGVFRICRSVRNSRAYKAFIFHLPLGNVSGCSLDDSGWCGNNGGNRDSNIELFRGANRFCGSRSPWHSYFHSLVRNGLRISERIGSRIAVQ